MNVERTCEGMNAGPSIRDMIWEFIDNIMDDLMAPKGTFDDEIIMQMKAEARGLALALAILMNPYEVNSSAIAVEAMDRWKLRHLDDEED